MGAISATAIALRMGLTSAQLAPAAQPSPEPQAPVADPAPASLPWSPDGGPQPSSTPAGWNVASPATPVIPARALDQMVFFQTAMVAQRQRGPVNVTVLGQDVSSRTVVHQLAVPVLGRARAPMGWTDFFHHVGRPDLAAEYARRAALVAGLRLGALGLSLVSGLPMTVGLVTGLGIILYERGALTGTARSSGPLTPLTAVGMAVVLLGAGAMIVCILAAGGVAMASRLVTVQPADPATLVDLAAQHNRSVLEQAGLPPDTPLPAP